MLHAQVLEKQKQLNFKLGDKLEGNDNGTWYPVQVINKDGKMINEKGKIRVLWSTDGKEDWLPPQKLRHLEDLKAGDRIQVLENSKSDGPVCYQKQLFDGGRRDLVQRAAQHT